MPPKGFYQIPVNPSDIPKTAFISPFGKFEFVRMLFGLRNAPATFQRLMEKVLVRQHDYSSPYIDDVIIYSLSWDDHLQHIDLVLDAIYKHGLTVKASKCVWAAQQVEYLGFTVGNGHLSVPEARVEAIRKLVRPVNIKHLRSFLGTVGFYRKFIPDFARYSSLLTKATKKGKPKNIQWTPEMDTAFIHLKNSLSSSLVLVSPTCNDVFVLTCDASVLGIGAVLCVVRGQWELPVSFFSRQLQEREQRYSASELECLAVVDAIQHFEVHLCDKPFTVFTDHKALTNLLTSTHLNRKLWRWALYVQQFCISFEYRPGKDNLVADYLSRQAWPTSKEHLPDLEIVKGSASARNGSIT